MTITRAGLAGKSNNGAGGTSISRSVGSVTAGQLVVFTAAIIDISGSGSAPVSADLTKTAGTSTVADIRMHRTDGGNCGEGTTLRVAEFSCLVTADGTLTLTLAGQPSGTFISAFSEAYNGNWASDATRAEAVNGAFDASNSASALSSGDATSAGGGLFVSVLGINNGVNTPITEDGAFTSLAEENDATQFVPGAMADRIVTTGTTDASNWTFSGMDGAAYNAQAASIVVFKESAAAATFEQEGARFGNDDGSESAHTWAAAQDANVTAPASTPLLLNIIVNATGSPGAKTFSLQSRRGSEPFDLVPVKEREGYIV
jgi:hypothetical protein